MLIYSPSIITTIIIVEIRSKVVDLHHVHAVYEAYLLCHVDGSTDIDALSVSSEASGSSQQSSLATAPRQYELPRRRPVAKSVLNKASRPKKRMLMSPVVVAVVVL